MPVRLTGVRGVVFDLDDTLYPECEFAYSGLAAVAEWLRARMACPADPAQKLREMFDSGRRGRLFDDLLAEWNCHSAAELVPQMVACYREHTPAIRLHPDAERAIQRWRGYWRLGLLTDGPLACQRRKIEALGLTSQLDAIVCTDEWGRAYWKPHHRAFEELERLWALSGRELVYIADNPSKDFVAPTQRGWHSVQVCRPTGEYRQIVPAPAAQPEFCVTSLDEIELTLLA